MDKFYVTVGKNPYGASLSQTEADCIRLAKQAKAEFPDADVVAWCESDGSTFEVWENADVAAANTLSREGLIEAARNAQELNKEWSGYPDPSDPDNFWIDDATGERVNATTGERTKGTAT